MDKHLFRSQTGQYVPPADTTNRAGGKAYAKSAEESLASYAATCMMGNTYYANAEEQLDSVLKLAAQCDAEFVAKCAVYSRKEGWLKDMPAILLASLCSPQRVDRPAANRALRGAFPKVIDNAKMLQNFLMALTSGRFGRKSWGTVPMNLARGWIQSRSQTQLFNDAIGLGSDGLSMSNIIKMLHPKSRDEGVNAMYGYLTGDAERTYYPKKSDGSCDFDALKRIRARTVAQGRDYVMCGDEGIGVKRYSVSQLHPMIQAYEAFKAAKLAKEPVDPTILDKYRYDFRALDALQLTDAEWVQVARKAHWMMTRMNLNTFTRHNVWKTEGMEELIAKRLADPEEVLASRNYPYQIFNAWKNITADVPARVADALQTAMELATQNVPEIPGNIIICPDVSGSMSANLPTKGKGMSKMRYVDVAAIFAAVIMRKNPRAIMLPFDTRLHIERLNPRDSITTLAEKVAAYGGGGTSMSLPLIYLNGSNEHRKKIGNISAVIYISDSESWADPNVMGWGNTTGTTLAHQWALLKRDSPDAKLVTIDITANEHKQAPSGADRLNIGGFNDRVFDVVKTFLEAKTASPSHWVDTINKLDLYSAPERVDTSESAS